MSYYLAETPTFLFWKLISQVSLENSLEAMGQYGN